MPGFDACPGLAVGIRCLSWISCRAYRAAVRPGLKLGRVREMEDRLKARIAGLLDKVETFGGEFDFVQHIAAPFPLMTQFWDRHHLRHLRYLRAMERPSSAGYTPDGLERSGTGIVSGGIPPLTTTLRPN